MDLFKIVLKSAGNLQPLLLILINNHLQLQDWLYVYEIRYNMKLKLNCFIQKKIKIQSLSDSGSNLLDMNLFQKCLKSVLYIN